MLLDDQVLIDAFGAETVAADRRLALVDKIEAKRTDQALVVVIGIGNLACESACNDSGCV